MRDATIGMIVFLLVAIWQLEQGNQTDGLICLSIFSQAVILYEIRKRDK